MEPGKRLNSWKAIAAYLKRDESTVRRWEREGLPVHRHLHAKKASVYAYVSEIDGWWNRDSTGLEGAAALAAPRRRRAWRLAGFTLVAFVLTSGSLALLESGSPALQANASVAVLPLENLSGDPQQEYLADGMTEALVNELGKVRTLRVVSRTSVMPYKGRKRALEELARDLQVDAVLEGAVVREGARVRVSAQLIRLGPERQVWAERYEREVSSILALQTDLAGAIAAQVEARLAGFDRTLLTKARPVSFEGYEASLEKEP